MFENNIELIRKSQQGNKEDLEKLINHNNRSYMEYSEKIYRKRI